MELFLHNYLEQRQLYLSAAGTRSGALDAHEKKREQMTAGGSYS
jgi:hypothetical protein